MITALDDQVLRGNHRARLDGSMIRTRGSAIDAQVLRKQPTPRSLRGLRGLGDGDTGSPIDTSSPSAADLASAAAYDASIGYTLTPPAGSSSSSSSPDVNLTSVINNADNNLTTLIRTLFAPPTLIQTAQGSIYRAPLGASGSLPSGLLGGTTDLSSFLPIILIGGALLVFMSMAGGRR